MCITYMHFMTVFQNEIGVSTLERSNIMLNEYSGVLLYRSLPLPTSIGNLSISPSLDHSIEDDGEALARRERASVALLLVHYLKPEKSIVMGGAAGQRDLFAALFLKFLKETHAAKEESN